MSKIFFSNFLEWTQTEFMILLHRYIFQKAQHKKGFSLFLVSVKLTNHRLFRAFYHSNRNALTEAMGCKSGDNESENGFNFKINGRIALLFRQTNHVSLFSNQKVRRRAIQKDKRVCIEPINGIWGHIRVLLYTERDEYFESKKARLLTE